MPDIRSGYTDYVRYRLKATNVSSFRMSEEPGGWSDDELELERHKTYHGIFTKFTNKLRFYGDAKDYILAAYRTGGINETLRLTKDITKNVTNEDGTSDVKYIQKYTSIADFSTMQVKDNELSIKFNSNDLAELIKSHESDEFEMERIDSIDNYVFPEELVLNKIDLEGRVISGTGEQKVDLTEFGTVKPGEPGIPGDKYQERLIGNTGFIVCKTLIVSQGSSERHTAVRLEGEFDETNPTSPDAQEALFFSNTDLEGTVVQLDVEFNVVVHLTQAADSSIGDNILDIVRYKWNGTGFDEVFVETLINVTTTTYGLWYTASIHDTRHFKNLEDNEGICLRWRKQNGNWKTIARFFTCTVKINVIETFERTPGASFMFTHDVFERLLYILTGEKNRFYSKFFGRIGLKDNNGNEIYAQDGLDENENLGGGLIGLISGYWVRAFDPESEKYKSLTISLKSLLDSCSAVFNTGVGIEVINFKERLRVEELKYFYREEVVVKLPFQVTNVIRKVDSKMFQSGIELGYPKAGDYENELGLDEPNVKRVWVTPIRKTKNKYNKTSDVRADEYEMEKTRRKPQVQFPEEDTNQDNDNWWLDIIRNDDVLENNFKQAHWTDRLDSEPLNIQHPDSFRTMIFTPLRMLFRHGWVIRTGLEPYRNKFIKYINATYNSFLTMHFIGDVARQENEDILVSDLERPKLLPEEITFEHPIDDDLSDLIFGTTRTLINGSYEDVPNFYFKFEWINENEEIERGYLVNLKPKGKGKFKMIKANENIN